MRENTCGTCTLSRYMEFRISNVVASSVLPFVKPPLNASSGLRQLIAERTSFAGTLSSSAHGGSSISPVNCACTQAMNDRVIESVNQTSQTIFWTQMRTYRQPKFASNMLRENQVAQVACHRDSDGGDPHAQEVHEATGAAQQEQTHPANTAFGQSSAALELAQ